MTAGRGALEAMLLRDRALVAVSLAVLTMLSWLYLLVLAKDTAAGDMTLMGLGEMTVAAGPMPWTGTTFVLMFAMWWVMMLGMMVPSAAPMILLFARVQRKKLPDEHPALRTAAFTGGYSAAWASFSLAAVLLQWGLGEAALLSPAMAGTSNLLGAALFLAAGVYQLSALKQACLRHCRSPMYFLAVHWRKGSVGALRMGVRHGAYCIGCCWFLMGLLFFGGVMNLLWVAIIAIFVIVEKLSPRGALVGRIGGLMLLGFGAVLLAAGPLAV